jgi:hypothetical protein
MGDNLFYVPKEIVALSALILMKLAVIQYVSVKISSTHLYPNSMKNVEYTERI